MKGSTEKMELTDKQQAYLMLGIFILPALGTWMALGFPTGKTELGILGSSLISGIMAFIKELAGWKPSDGWGDDE